MSAKGFSSKNIFLFSGLLIFATAPAAFAGFDWKGPLEAPRTAPGAMMPATATATNSMSDLEPVISWDGQSPSAAPNGVQNASMTGDHVMPAQKVESVEAMPMTPVYHQAPSVQPANMPADAMPMNGMAAPADAMPPVPLAPPSAPMAQPSAPMAQPSAPIAPPTPPAVMNGSLSSDEKNNVAWSGQAAPAPAPQDSSEIVNGFGSGMPLVIALQQIVPPGYQLAFANGVNPGVPVSWEGGKPWHTVLDEALKPHDLGYRIQNSNIIVVGTFETAPELVSAPMSPETTSSMSTTQTPRVLLSHNGDTDVPPAADVYPTNNGVMDAAKSAPASSVAPAISNEPVYIRRQKPSSLMERMRRSLNVDADINTPEADTKGITATSTMSATSPDMSDDMSTDASSVMSQDASAAQDMSTPVSQDSDMNGSSTSSTPLSMPLSMPPQMDSPQNTLAPMPLSRAPDAPASGTAVESLSGQMTTPAAMGQTGSEPAWQGGKGQTLRDVLKGWADTAGVELYWSIDYDYRLQEDANYFGTFDEAVGKLLDRYASVRPQPFGELHQSTDGPRVLVIKSYDISK